MRNHSLQVMVDASASAAAEAMAQALTPLLHTAQLRDCSMTARQLLHALLSAFSLMNCVRWGPIPASPLFAQAWAIVVGHPSPLLATVEALQACQETAADQLEDRLAVEIAVQAHLDFVQSQPNDAGLQYVGALLGSDSMQHYLISGLTAALTPEHLPQLVGTTLRFMALAAESGAVPSSRLEALLTHEGILAPLRRAAAGKAKVGILLCCGTILACGWQASRDQPFGAAEAKWEARNVLLAALQQALVILQLSTVPPYQRLRAVQRASREGWLKVRPSTAHVPLVFVMHTGHDKTYFKHIILCRFGSIGGAVGV